MDKLGFIGLGIMGGPMASNLLNNGREVTVFNRSQPAIDRLVELRAKPAKSPREVAEQSDIVITCLPYPHDVEQVVCGPNGILEGARPGSAIIDTSTIDPQTSQKVAAMVAEKGVGMLDAPLAGGGPKGAGVGKQTLMIGGRKEVFERCQEVLNILGNNIIYVGDNGMGLVVKLCFNMYALMTAVSAAETFAFGVKLGADAKTIFETINTARGGDWYLQRKCPVPGCTPDAPSNKDFEAQFFLELAAKDIGLVRTAMSATRTPLLMTSLTQQMFDAANNMGLGRKDSSAISILVRQLAGLEEPGS